jgi:hypothetical protein
MVRGVLSVLAGIATLTLASFAIEVALNPLLLRHFLKPWEAYLNDPADYPNPQDWKTEVCWPLGT